MNRISNVQHIMDTKGVTVCSSSQTSESKHIEMATESTTAVPNTSRSSFVQQAVLCSTSVFNNKRVQQEFVQQAWCTGSEHMTSLELVGRSKTFWNYASAINMVLLWTFTGVMQSPFQKD